jgi:hypothetical protein
LFVFHVVLPNTPVSVQYTTTNFAANLPMVPKTLSTQSVAIQPQSAQSIVHNLQQQQLLQHQKPGTIHGPSATAVSFTPQAIRSITASQANTLHSLTTSITATTQSGTGNVQFQRLKVEDALSYLDQVRHFKHLQFIVKLINLLLP